MSLYRKTRQRIQELLLELQQAGYNQVCIHGDGDIADICRLSCLEQGIKVIEEHPQSSENNVPVLDVIGTKVFLEMEV